MYGDLDLYLRDPDIGQRRCSSKRGTVRSMRIILTGLSLIHLKMGSCPDEKENQIFLTCKEIHKGAVAESYRI
jgi:hypothetical protein